MRFAEAAVAALLSAALAMAAPAHAGAEAVRADLLERLKLQMPDVGVASFGLGAAAFDPSLQGAEDAAAAGIVAAGRRIWQKRFRNGKSLGSCFPNGGRRIAATYPQYDARLKKVVTLETAINQCLLLNKEAPFDPSDAQAMGAVLAWLRSQSDGQKIAVRVSGSAAEERFDAGRSLFFMRSGQQNFACASCHLQAAGRIYANSALPPVVGLAAQWPVIRDGQVVTITGRIRECLARMGAAPVNFSAEDFAHLEYFLAYLANGYPLKANAIRRN
jgi:L-cysteine S-thiosulfotransferase